MTGSDHSRSHSNPLDPGSWKRSSCVYIRQSDACLLSWDRNISVMMETHSSDIVQGDELRGKASVNTEEAIVDEGSDR